MRTSLLGKVHVVASKCDPETRARAVRLVLDHREDYPSDWAAITAVSKRLGMTAETLRNWVRQHQVDAGERDGVSSAAAAEIRVPCSRWMSPASFRVLLIALAEIPH